MIIEKGIDQQTPYTFYSLDGAKRPLCLYFHGFTSDKDSGIMGRGEVLAQLGFTVCAIDAIGHGLRKDAALMNKPASEKYKAIADIVIETAHDASAFYHRFLKTHAYVEDGHLAVFGTSMGAMIGFTLLQLLPNITSLISIVGTPSLFELYTHKMNTYAWEKEEHLLKKLEILRALDPTSYLLSHPHISIFMGCGTEDEVVPMAPCEQLQFVLSRENVVFQPYTIGHSSNEAMLQDSYDFLTHQFKRNNPQRL